MTLAQFKAANPGITAIGGEGRWLVIWCGSRATRYASYHVARADSIGECTNAFCKGEHDIVEIVEPPSAAPAKPLSKSFLRMVESA